MYTLNVEKRTKADNIAALKKTAKIPAVFYGPKQESTSVSVPVADFIKVWKKAGESSIITIKEGAHDHEALIHEVDVHPLTGAPRHADFYVIEKGKKLKVDVHLVFEGTAPAVKDFGGILVKVLHEVEIEALPKDLPHEIKVNISTLSGLDSVIHARDLALPSGVTLVTAADDIIASIATPKEEVEDAPTTVDMSAIEVEKKGKEAKEGAEGESEEKKD